MFRENDRFVNLVACDKRTKRAAWS